MYETDDTLRTRFQNLKNFKRIDKEELMKLY